MSQLIRRAGGSLAVKALPAIYGVGLILLVVRVIPLGDFGRYAMAIAYVNLIAVLARGLWAMPLTIFAARGEREAILAPAFWMSSLTAAGGGLAGLVILPLLGVGFTLAVYAALLLIILVPRDLAYAIIQAEGRVGRAFQVEAGYSLGSLAGFALFAAFGLLNGAETAMLANLGAAALSALLGVIAVPAVLKPGLTGDWKGIFDLGKWVSLSALGDIFLQQGDALLVGIFFAPEVIAPYLVARTLLRMYALFSQAVNFLVLPSASRLQASGQMPLLRRRLRQVLTYTLAGLVPVNAAMWFAAPVLFPLVLGGKYVPAIPFFRLIILATFFEPVYSILANAIAGIGLPRRSVPVLVTALVFNIAANLVLLPLFGLWAAPVVLVVTYAVLAIGMRRLADRHLVAA